jgi:hypothetical protein
MLMRANKAGEKQGEHQRNSSSSSKKSLLLAARLQDAQNFINLVSKSQYNTVPRMLLKTTLLTTLSALATEIQALATRKSKPRMERMMGKTLRQQKANQN